MEYYTINKKVYHYEPSPSEQAEIDKQKRKQWFGRLKAEKLAQEQYRYEHQGGYCPKCFLLRTINGVCNNCD